MPVDDHDPEFVKQILSEKEAERTALLDRSLKEVEELGRKLHKGEINAATYKKQAEGIELEIKNIDYEISNLKSTLGIGEEKKRPIFQMEEKRPGVPPILYILVLITFGIVLAYAYTHSMCVAVNFSTQAPEILDLLGIVKDKSPEDYQMICKYVDSVDYQHSYLYGGYAFFRNGSGSRQVILSSVMMSYYNESRYMPASVLVHETCHYMMYGIMGGFKGMTEAEVERPCERTQYMFLYRSGYFKDYLSMVEGLSQERYGRENLPHTSGIPTVLRPYLEDKIYKYTPDVQNYCSRTVLGVEEVNSTGGIDLRLTNKGETLLHCGFIELLVNGLEYPLDCFELPPGESHTTGRDFHLNPKQQYSIKVSGCDNTLPVKNT